MRVLFNATTNVSGGGVKNSAIFIRQVAKLTRHEWHFAVSPQVDGILKAWGVSADNMSVFDQSPARSLSARRELVDLQTREGFDIAYTMAGPAYVKFTCPSVMGISNGYISHVDAKAFLFTRPLRRWIPDALTIAYQSIHSRRADYVVFQTNAARDGFCGRLWFPLERTFVVPNAFDPEIFSAVVASEPSSKLKVLVPSAPYPHKLLSRVPSIAAAWNTIPGGPEAEFLLTLDPGGDAWKAIEAESRKLGVSNSVRTIDQYRYSDAAKIYSQGDVVLSLSVLETFSATALEAFCAKRPHVVADRTFAREVCGDAAVYIDPYDAMATARAIKALSRDPDRQKELVAAGETVLLKFGSQADRIDRIISVLELVASQCASESVAPQRS